MEKVVANFAKSQRANMQANEQMDLAPKHGTDLWSRGYLRGVVSTQGIKTIHIHRDAPTRDATPLLFQPQN